MEIDDFEAEQKVEFNIQIILWFLYQAMTMAWFYYNDHGFINNLQPLFAGFLLVSAYLLVQIWRRTDWARYAYGAVVIGYYLFVGILMLLAQDFTPMFPSKWEGTWNLLEVYLELQIIKVCFFSRIKFLKS